ncbi:MAG: hypothetical protein ACYDHW_01040 [Syntrophorhabdaceae bacterium]
MKKFSATIIALIMFLAFICPSVIAAPRKVTKPAQNVEKSTEAVDSTKTKATNKVNQKVAVPPVDKMKQAGDTKAKTPTAK